MPHVETIARCGGIDPHRRDQHREGHVAVHIELDANQRRGAAAIGPRIRPVAGAVLLVHAAIAERAFADAAQQDLRLTERLRIAAVGRQECEAHLEAIARCTVVDERDGLQLRPQPRQVSR